VYCIATSSSSYSFGAIVNLSLSVAASASSVQPNCEEVGNYAVVAGSQAELMELEDRLETSLDQEERFRLTTELAHAAQRISQLSYVPSRLHCPDRRSQPPRAGSIFYFTGAHTTVPWVVCSTAGHF